MTAISCRAGSLAALTFIGLGLSACVTSGETGNQTAVREAYVECLTAYVAIAQSAALPISLEQAGKQEWCGDEEAAYRKLVVARAYRVPPPGRQATADAAIADLWKTIAG